MSGRRARWSLRARVFSVISAAALAPVALLLVTHWLEDAEQDRTDVELGSALEEVVSGIDRPDLDAYVASVAARRGVRIRVIDPHDRRVDVDVDRERGTRMATTPLGWLYYPADVPTLSELDASWLPIFDRSEVRQATSDRATMGCHSDARGSVLVCHAVRRAGERVVYVQRGFVRGAVRAIFERKRELFRLAIVLLPVTLVLGFWLSRRMLQPLESLRTEALARARAVDPSAPLTIERGDEIGDVKQALNALLAALRDQKSATESFVADLAHEAKNPVASIRACADALATGELTGERRERLVGNLRRSSDRLDRLVSELLELARVQAGMPRESQTRVDLAELVRGIATEAQKPGVEVVVDGENASVRGVPMRLEAALRNLIDNAVSFATARVSITLAREGDRIRVQVSDDGPGIEAELLPRVFDRFFTTRGSREGTGLGLAMVRAIAEAHGGQALVSSTPSGAVFELLLPA